MNEHIRANRDHWNDLTDVHVASSFYDLPGFLASWHEGNVSPPPGADELGSIRDLDVLHLQCHFGMDTLRLQRLGARVTGVDLSDRAIDEARRIARELNVAAAFHCSDVLALDLDTQFDLVYTSLGVLCWLPDLRRWGQVIARHLKPGARFFMLESHPFAHVFDDERADGLHPRYPYFDAAEPWRWEDQGSYADFNATVEHPLRFEWTHSVSDILTALIEAGLRLESFRESPIAAYRMLPCMVERRDGWALPEDMKNMLPFTFLLQARKPA